MKNIWSVDFPTLFITYIVVKTMHYLAGFNYDILDEGIFTFNFLIDLASWGIVYAVVYFLMKKLRTRNSATA